MCLILFALSVGPNVQPVFSTGAVARQGLCVLRPQLFHLGT